MKNLLCREIPADETHNVMILFRNNCYDCYVMRQDEDGNSTPYSYMFGQLRNQPYTKNLSLDDIIDIAVANAPEYYFLCDGEEVTS